jgi:hypothetical protein
MCCALVPGSPTALMPPLLSRASLGWWPRHNRQQRLSSGEFANTIFLGFFHVCQPPCFLSDSVSLLSLHLARSLPDDPLVVLARLRTQGPGTPRPRSLPVAGLSPRSARDGCGAGGSLVVSSRGGIRVTMPHAFCSSAISLPVRLPDGTACFRRGASPARAAICVRCSLVHVGTAPGRGASWKRWAQTYSLHRDPQRAQSGESRSLARLPR